MRLLSVKEEYLRKRKFPKDSKKSAVTYAELQQTFNIRAGFKSDENASYALRMVKMILNSCLKPSNKGFPGGWIHANRKINGVKSDFALVNLLGWTEIIPSQHKMLEVIFNTVDEDLAVVDDKPRVVKRKLINITVDKRNLLHREFRTAVTLCLPRIDPDSSISMDDQLKVDQLSSKSTTVINNFKHPKRSALVDSLNESYNFRVSLKNPKSKTKEVHYKISRDRMLDMSANIPLIDAKGREYAKFSETPKKVQDYLRKTFRYPSKRSREDDLDLHMEIDQGSLQVEVTETSAVLPRPLKRQKKITRGQAAQAVRRSGRLARNEKKL
jgi:hypothetical protein